LHTLDVSNNRLTGTIAATLIAQLLLRNIDREHGYNLHTLNISRNNIETSAAGIIFKALCEDTCYLRNIKMNKIAIQMIAGIEVKTVQ